MLVSLKALLTSDVIRSRRTIDLHWKLPHFTTHFVCESNRI